MKKRVMAAFAIAIVTASCVEASEIWYTGGGRCVPPKDDGTYAAPYNAMEHPGDYPTFPGADRPGWSCSYQREDGVIVQYGNSLTPQQQWLAFWVAGKGDQD
ncbi:hypothetical protein [Geomonas ferrireducens]|uniref:hypothetical protein n=1 Tax=Geomonas ferrireducens TaxID=2570227 RepID=UPI0010A9356C|nr:hypothetical protein [Geomonas ferrireducens]